jgi:DNA-directed RNA polymerase specialized sigma24 family protein
LKFYFSRRYGAHNAEDLAQDTMLAVLTRDDFQFDKEQDFLRVCYAFAKRTGKARLRGERKHAAIDIADVAPVLSAGPPNAIENGIFLREVLEAGAQCLNARQLDAVVKAAEAEADRGDLHTKFGFPDANSFRVFLHRTRRKLAEKVGYRRR